jgi:hypothetical protein
MTAPTAQCKTYDLVKDEDALMRFNLVKLGAENAMDGLEKGPEGLVDVLSTQASHSNLPRVGYHENVGFPFFQANIAAGVEPNANNESSAILPLGKFGFPHIDDKDCPASPTAMLNLSPEYDDVEPQYFYVMEFGVGWLMEPLSTFYFSGLHFHGGCQPRYKPNRQDPDFIYYRIALIAYPNEDAMSGQDATAFATLANDQLLMHGYEFRNA